MRAKAPSWDINHVNYEDGNNDGFGYSIITINEDDNIICARCGSNFNDANTWRNSCLKQYHRKQPCYKKNKK